MDAALTARRALDVFHDGGDLTPPIDPVRVARSLGINVYASKLDNSLSGMIVKAEPTGGVDIFLNSEHSSVRQRFTCAHELGHYFAIQAGPNPESRTYIHRRDARSECGTHDEEIFANQFAAELLMPEASVKSARAAGMDAYDLAARFQVSLDAIGYRLKNLRLA